MRSRIKTGDVFQIRRNGTNYITLGKVRGSDGHDYVVATKNGNVAPCGTLKKGHTRDRRRVKPKIHVLSGGSIKKVHGNREVCMESVIARGGHRVKDHLQRTTASNGVLTDAPNIMAQLADLKASI